MKVSALNIRKTPHHNKSNNIQQVNNLNTKEIDIVSTDLTANYNIAFNGLFQRKTVPKYDTTRLMFEHKMEPNTPYLVDYDSEFLLSSFKLDLKDSSISKMLHNLKKGEHLIFGRTGIFLSGMNNEVSKQHLKIEKGGKDTLIATDMGSLNGTRILPNVIVPDCENGAFRLTQNKRYLLPLSSILNIGGYQLNLKEHRENILKLPEKDVYPFKVFNQTPLELERFQDKIIARNLSPNIDTYFISPGETKYVNDLSHIWGTALLQVGVPTLIPENCHLRLGSEVTIDTRNKQIKELLDKKQRIIIGRRDDCDYVIDSFNNRVSDVHLSLEKTSKGLVATDLNSSNLTFVIPNKDTKAFYNVGNSIFLKQGNIGDCSLLSTLYSLYLNPKGREIIQNMVSIDSNGDYLVQFNGKKPIRVGLDELYGQENKKGERKIAVEGELGIKAIERAYAKYINKGFSPTMFGEIDNGLPLKKPLADITGLKPTNYSINQHTNIDNIFSYIINNDGLASHVITCATPRIGKFGKYMDRENRFISSHAYSIQNINIQGRYVEIVNPHNTKGFYILPFDDFGKYFSEICDLKL